MSIHETEGAQMFDFMTPEEFDDLWDVNIVDTFRSEDPLSPNGYYEKIPPEEAGLEGYPPAYVVWLPSGLDNQDTAIALLRQMELVRREIRDGRPGLPELDGDERFYAQIELQMLAAGFYFGNREIVDDVVRSIVEVEIDDDFSGPVEPFQEEGH